MTREKEISSIFDALEKELRLQKILCKANRYKKPSNPFEEMNSIVDKAIDLRLVLIEEKLKNLKAKYL